MTKKTNASNIKARNEVAQLRIWTPATASNIKATNEVANQQPSAPRRKRRGRRIRLEQSCSHHPKEKKEEEEEETFQKKTENKCKQCQGKKGGEKQSSTDAGLANLKTLEMSPASPPCKMEMMVKRSRALK